MIETAAGILLIAIALADLFATVLLVRSDASILSPFVTRAVWWLFKRADRRLGLDGRLMMLAGPILLVLIVLLWALLLVTGFALLYLPMLGQAVNASTGTLRPTFGAAMYFSGYDFSTLGLGDVVPRSGAARMLTVIEACTGFGAVTLAISYTLNIYNAVNRQESFALQLHGGSDATGWAAVALTGLYPAGKPDQNASSLLEAIAGQAYQLLQIHRSYPLARYYRRRQPELSTVRITFHLLDLVTLIEAVFSAGQYRYLLGTHGFVSLRHAAFAFVEAGRGTDPPADPASWRGYFDRSIELIADNIAIPAAGEVWLRYAGIRCRWDGPARHLVEHLGYSYETIASPSIRPGRRQHGAA